MHERYFTMEHNNTGKSPQKRYSCTDEGMDKLTEIARSSQAWEMDWEYTVLEYIG